MRSLRARLLLWLIGAIALAAAAGGWIVYRNALAQADLFFDQQLRQVALTLRDQAFEFAAPPLSVEPDFDFVVQVWSANGVRVYLSQPHAVLPGITGLGFSTVDTRSERWRVYGVFARNYVIQVAQPQSVRSARAVQFALRTLQPFALIVPMLAVLIWVVVGRTLQPLSRLAKAVRAREPEELAALDVQDIPDEARPLVDALNDLLARLSAALARERAFIADAAHELRTPLAALKLQVQSLEHASDPETKVEQIARLTQGVDRATRLAEQLLSLARLDPTSRSEQVSVDLDALVRNVIADLVPLADQRQIDIGMDQFAGVRVNADEDALRMLVRNLLDNALRYTPLGGRVDVATVKTDEAVELRVADTGPGIPPAERERVFDRFYRVPGSNVVGSGLGLAIVKAVAQTHGATVRLTDNAQGHGLCVVVRFPLPSA